jgi:hypothetical protein
VLQVTALREALTAQLALATIRRSQAIPLRAVAAVVTAHPEVIPAAVAVVTARPGAIPAVVVAVVGLTAEAEAVVEAGLMAAVVATTKFVKSDSTPGPDIFGAVASRPPEA